MSKISKKIIQVTMQTSNSPRFILPTKFTTKKVHGISNFEARFNIMSVHQKYKSFLKLTITMSILQMLDEH